MVNSVSGRRKYHGSQELIASNRMQVLNVLSFAGKADVRQWDEEDDNLTSKLYWRQTFCIQTETLSVSFSPLMRSHVEVYNNFARSSENTVFAMGILTLN
jgi:hypothetical protein